MSDTLLARVNKIFISPEYQENIDEGFKVKAIDVDEKKAVVEMEKIETKYARLELSANSDIVSELPF